MSRKDLVAFAEAISKIKDGHERVRTAVLIAEVCIGLNSRFDWYQFMAACDA